MQRAGVPVTTHTSLQIDAVFSCLRVISNAIIKMGDPLGYQVKLDKDNVPYRAYLNPQPAILTDTFGRTPQTGQGMWQFDGRTRIITSMALFGEAFLYALDFDRFQYPTAVEVLNPAFIDVRKGKNPATGQEDGRVEYWYGAGVNRVLLETERVTHIPFMALPGGTRGLSALEYGGIAFALALAAMEYGQRWFSQGASPSFLLSTPAKLGEEEIRRIAQKFLVEHSGLQSAHLPLVVDSGLDVKKIGATPDEAQYLGTLQYARECIAGWFGIPSHLVGGDVDKGQLWGKTIQEQAIQLVDFTLSGYIVRLNEAYSSFLPAGQKAAFNEDAIMTASYDVLAKGALELRTATLITQNEGRRRFNLGPVKGGDNLDAPLASNTAATAITGAPPVENDAPAAPAPATPVPTPGGNG
jgi:HK97 family phage portal protein